MNSILAYIYIHIHYHPCTLNSAENLAALSSANREEKSLRDVAVVAQFLDDNKPKASLKVNSHCFKLHWFYLISFNLSNIGKFSGVESKRMERKGKFLSIFVFTYSIKQACEISKFHVTVVPRRLKNVQKSMMQSCCFANLNLLLFCHSCCWRHCRCLSSLLLSSKNFFSMVTWHHTSPLYC